MVEYDEGGFLKEKIVDTSHEGSTAYVAIAVEDEKRQEVMEFLQSVPEVQEAMSLENPMTFSDQEDPQEYSIFAKFNAVSREQLHQAIYGDEALDHEAIQHTATMESLGVDEYKWERVAA